MTPDDSAKFLKLMRRSKFALAPRIEVVIRQNDGEKTVRLARDEAEAQSLVKAALTPSNHMVRMDVDGEKWQRWDRDFVVGQNRWRDVDPHSFEVLGPIRQAVRPIV